MRPWESVPGTGRDKVGGRAGPAGAGGGLGGRTQRGAQREGTTSNEMLMRCWSEVNGSVRW